MTTATGSPTARCAPAARFDPSRFPTSARPTCRSTAPALDRIRDMSPRAAIAGLLIVGGCVAGWFWIQPPAPPDSSAVGSDEPRPIPVRADSEVPYNPSQFNLTLDQSIAVFEE